MSLNIASVAVLALFLCSWPASAIPESEFDFVNCPATQTIDIDQESILRVLPSSGGRFVVLNDCRDLARIRVRMCINFL